MNDDYVEAQVFIDFIAFGTQTTFQVFGESPSSTVRPTIIHGYNPQNFERIFQYNEAGAGVFMMVNEGDGKGRKGENVTSIRAFFLDLDKNGDTCLQKISDLPKEVRPHIIIQSSPGKYHVYWRIKEGFPLERFSEIQGALADKFGGDPTVKDLARVMRIPAFYHHKDPDRIFRTRIHQLNSSRYYDAETLIKGLGLQAPSSSPNINLDLLPISNEPIPEGQRNDTIFRHGCSLRSRGIAEPGIKAEIAQLNQARCVPPLSQSELDAIVESIMRYPQGEPPQEISQTHTDLNNAEHFIALFGKLLRYVPEFKKWIIWDGRRWAIDDADKVLTYAKKTIRHAQQQAMQIDDVERRQRTIRKLLECENVNRIKAIIELARIDDQVILHQHKLDCDPYLINVLNGTIDMLSQTFKAHDPEDYITQLLQVKYEQPVIIMS